MIQGVLGEHAEEAIETEGAIEEEKAQVQLRDKRIVRIGWLLNYRSFIRAS